jgi:hypothetical protein
VAVLGAPERRRLAGRRATALEPGAAAPVPPVTTGRATIIDAATPLPDAEGARAWLRGAGAQDVHASLAVLNRVLRAHRLASADPWAREVALGDALAVRVGYASGAQAAEGRLADARELAPAAARRRRRSRTSALRPQEHMAAVLAGRARSLACEELALRARADLDAGRPRLAALGIGLALEAALAELGDEPVGGDLATRIVELRELRDGAARAARAAIAGEPSAADVEAAAGALERLEAALRARAAALS